MFNLFPSVYIQYKVNKGAKIKNRYNQVPHMTQDTNGKVTPETRSKRAALSQQVTTYVPTYKQTRTKA